VLAGCANNSPAPVSNRSPTGLEKPAAVEVKPGYYMVKKGDTLYSLALDHGQDHKDIVAWNNIDNPNLIRIGQILRVAPPEGAAASSTANSAIVETRPVAPPIEIESRPVDGKPVVAVAAAGATNTLKREPKGGIQPYSDDAWAQIQKPASAPAAATVTQSTTTLPPAAAVPATTASTVPSPSKSAEPTVKPSTAAVAATDINWAWPTNNKVTTPFSEGSNKGLDFNGASGDPVLAAASGKVTLVTNSLRGYGNLIVVKHNATYLSVYAHNSKMLVTEGQAVSKGQKIAEIGSTDSDRPNLHFEIRREGKPIDPAKYLPQR
jgi:lipoprotein NlpD